MPVSAVEDTIYQYIKRELYLKSGWSQTFTLKEKKSHFLQLAHIDTEKQVPDLPFIVKIPRHIPQRSVTTVAIKHPLYSSEYNP